MTESLLDAVRTWRDADPDPETRAEIDRRVAARDEAWLREGFAGRLEFGTAGLRGPLGPGPKRMNRLTVRRVSRALAEQVVAAGGRRVVVGFDGRRGSSEFAADAARVFAGAGLEVHAFDELCPTPVLAYAVLALGADAGVMVTASHNPPEDNGYKVYGGDGAQIVSPTDQQVSARLDASPVGSPIPLGPAPIPVSASVVDAYVREVLALRVHPDPVRRPIVAYTPLHGVGLATVLRVLTAAGYDVRPVPEQAQPDGAFPTVRFPNPEEKGALDRVLALAAEVGAELVLANDPDADRIAVAIPAPGGGFRALTGNEVGCLLAEDLLAHGGQGGRRLVATSLVSSSLLQRIARHHGAEYAETLTGFKWIARAGLASEARFVMGFEEALGVCVGTVVRDKDGVSAALMVADLAADRLDRGGLGAALDELHLRHGVHLASQLSWTLPGTDGQARIAATMASVRATPPTTLGGREVVASFDTAARQRRDHRTGEVAPTTLPRSDVLGFELEGGDRVLLRPSGTEPKLKAYVEVVQSVGADGLGEARRAAQQRLERLREELTALVAG